ncbi:DUF397 domain-containing protein [Kitasatospora sp. NPDC001574]
MTNHFPNASATGLRFTKSSHSTDQANCVEAAALPGGVAVRDSKDPEGPALAFPVSAFTRFALAAGNNSLAPVRA